jgi:hypothetical protein
MASIFRRIPWPEPNFSAGMKEEELDTHRVFRAVV